MSASVRQAAATLGKRGGSVRSEAKADAARANGKRGGRPVKTITVGAQGDGRVTVHADASLVGYTASSQPAFVARTPAAARWLKRHGYTYGDHALVELHEELPTGKCWV